MSKAVRPSEFVGQERTDKVDLARRDTIVFAPLWSRLAARIVDGIVIVGVFAPLVAVLGTDAVDLGNGGAVSIVFWVTLTLAVILYEVVLIAVCGQTIGKRATGLKVFDAADGGVPGWAKSVRRCASMIPFWLIIPLGMVTDNFADWVPPRPLLYAIFSGLLGGCTLWIVVAHRRQRRVSPIAKPQVPGKGLGDYPSWHDRAAGTLVIKQ